MHLPIKGVKWPQEVHSRCCARRFLVGLIDASAMRRRARRTVVWTRQPVRFRYRSLIDSNGCPGRCHDKTPTRLTAFAMSKVSVP